MNGEPLPESHGFPARLIIPGFFGLKSVKWLKKIEPVPIDYAGYWQQRGWTDGPGRQDDVEDRYAGDEDGTAEEGISRSPEWLLRVTGAFPGWSLVSTAGETWIESEEMTEPLSAYTWIIWKARVLSGSSRHAEVRVPGDGRRRRGPDPPEDGDHTRRGNRSPRDPGRAGLTPWAMPARGRSYVLLGVSLLGLWRLFRGGCWGSGALAQALRQAVQQEHDGKQGSPERG